jgi:hypothetical protein
MTQESFDPVLLDNLLTQIYKLVGPLNYGTVELTFHQGKLVQIEKKEKVRVAEVKVRP